MLFIFFYYAVKNPEKGDNWIEFRPFNSKEKRNVQAKACGSQFDRCVMMNELQQEQTKQTAEKQESNVPLCFNAQQIDPRVKQCYDRSGNCNLFFS